MNRILRILLWTVLVAWIGIAGFFVIGISLIGDRVRNCRIKIQNERDRPLILKTFKYSAFDKKLSVDSIVLANSKVLEIGHCINCSKPDTLDLKFDAIGFYDQKMNIKILDRKGLIDYLETNEKEDCITYKLK